MVERPGERDDERYDWLYGGSRADAGTQSHGPTDPEPTQVLPVSGTPGRTAAYSTPAPTRPYQPPGEPPRQPPYQRPGQPRGGPPPRRTAPRRWPKVLLLVLVAWLVFLVAVPIWAWSKIDKVDAEPIGTRPADTPGTTYLLVGSDSRAGLTKEQRQRFGTGDVAGQRTDTIMLLHVPSGGGPTLLLSIPRDSYVDIPGYGMNKVNAAFSIGGPDLLVHTVEQATDLRVDDYIEIGFGGFVNIVDAVGGVRICPKTAMTDPKAKLDIAKGCQEADGLTALGYVRSRSTDPLGDIGRGARQREVVGAVAGKAASPMTVLLPWRYVSLAGAGADAVRIGEDVGPLDLVRFAWAVSRMSDGLTCAVPVSSLGTSTSVGSVVTWDEAAASELFDTIAEDRTESINCSPTGGV